MCFRGGGVLLQATPSASASTWLNPFHSLLSLVLAALSVMWPHKVAMPEWTTVVKVPQMPMWQHPPTLARHFFSLFGHCVTFPLGRQLVAPRLHHSQPLWYRRIIGLLCKQSYNNTVHKLLSSPELFIRHALETTLRGREKHLRP